MGYDETVRGWCRLARPIDFDTVDPPTVDNHTFDGPPGQRWWARAIGRRGDHAVFAAAGKNKSNVYIALLRSMIQAAGGGTGLLLSTGEIPGDGRDRLVVVRGQAVRSLPIGHLYDTRSAWHAVYERSHYMRHDVDRLMPVDVGRLRAELRDSSEVNGWLDVPFGGGHDVNARAGAAAEGNLTAVPALAGGIDSTLAHQHVLIGQTGVDAATVVAAVARATTEQSGAYAVLYCGTPDDGGRSQVPVAIEAGLALVLPAVTIDPADYPDAVPARTDAYSWLGGGSQELRLRSPLDLHRLFGLIMVAVGVGPAEPAVYWRECTMMAGEPGYWFSVDGLTFCLVSVPVGWADASAWPYLLGVFHTYDADPDRLAAGVRSVADRLRAAGVEVGGKERSWPTQR